MCVEKYHIDMTGAVRPRSAGLTKPDKEDEVADELGEEEDEELEGCGECGENAGGASYRGICFLKLDNAVSLLPKKNCYPPFIDTRHFLP